jgi:hypothetical protein
MLRRPIGRYSVTVDTVLETVPDAEPRRRELSPLLTIRAVQVVLWLLVISGPVAALLVANHLSSIDDRLQTLSANIDREVPPDTSGAEGFAELFIAAYLGAGEDSIDALSPFVDGVALDGVEAGSWSAIGTTSLGATEVSPGYYAVVVAAEVVATDPESDSQPVGVRYFSVGVVETTTGWAVTGLPALIPPPSRVTAPVLLIGRFDGLAGAPGLEEMLPRFLAAFLTGVGELNRYTSPSSLIVAVQPPPFASVEVLQSGVIETSDGFTEVAVLVRGTDADGRIQVLEYALVVELRDGRWEVSRLLPAPTLAPSETN